MSLYRGRLLDFAGWLGELWAVKDDEAGRARRPGASMKKRRRDKLLVTHVARLATGFLGKH